jgi:hypothetical protein
MFLNERARGNKWLVNRPELAKQREGDAEAQLENTLPCIEKVCSIFLQKWYTSALFALLARPNKRQVIY